MIKQFIPSKVCLACFGCCRFAEKGSVWNPPNIKLVPGKGQSNFLCSFLNPKNNKCRIYPHRPFDCRLYPFLICRRGKKVFLSADLNCPYLEKHLESGEVKKYVVSLLNFLNSKKFLKVLKDNPQIAQEYPGLTDIAEIGNA